MAKDGVPERLRILLQFVRTTQSGDPYGFHFAPQEYVLPTMGGESPSARFEWDDRVLSDLLSLRQPGRDPSVLQRVGERLRQFIWNAGYSQYEPQIRQAIEQQQPVEITIRSSAAELYALPWSLLTLRTGQYLGECDSVLLRFEWPETICRDEQPSPRREGGRILLAWSAAGGAVPAAEHIQALTAANPTGLGVFYAARDVIANASLDRMVRALAAAQQSGESISVLHILCHGAALGRTFGLCLDGEEEAVCVDAGQLRAQLAPFASMVRLVVLSACDGGNVGQLGNQLGSVAQALHRCGFEAVIASSAPLSVSGSVTFAQAFYSKLLRSIASVEAAFLSARRKLLNVDASQPQDQRALDWLHIQLLSCHREQTDTRPIVFRPYRGLLAFQPEHSRFFFGRDTEIAEIERDLASLIAQGKPRLLIVAGASGTGKSSLVFAGAVPKLLAANPSLQLLRMRPGANPEQTLRETLASLLPGRQGLLVVDQFEEVFVQTASESARSAFVQQLWTLASAEEPGLRIVLTLRVDFIGRCGDLVVDRSGLRLDRIAYDDAHRIFVSQLSGAQLADAIVLPARRVGIVLEPGLTERMISEVGQEPGALPLLQDALDVLWQRRTGSVLTQTSYDAIGGVVGALQLRADSLIEQLARQGHEHLTRYLFVSLVAVAEDTALDTRLRVRLSDLYVEPGTQEQANRDAVLAALVSARLLTQDSHDAVPTVEVAHEALIRKWPTLRRWLDEDRAGLAQRRRVTESAKQWEREQYDVSLLYRGTQLAIAEEWRKTWNPRIGERERRFLDAATALRSQEAQQRAEIERREKEASAQILSLLLDSYVEKGHQLLQDGRTEEGLLWLHRAYQQGSKSRTLPYLLRRALQPVDLRRDVLSIRFDEMPVSATSHPDGQSIVVLCDSGVALMIDRASGQERSVYSDKRGCQAVFDPVGQRILFYSLRGAVIVDAHTGAVLVTLPQPLKRASFHHDKEALLGITESDSFVCLDPQRGECLHEIASSDALGTIWSYSHDGSRLLCRLSNEHWQVVTVNGLHPLCRFAGPEQPYFALLDRSGQRVFLLCESPDRPHHLNLCVHDATTGDRLYSREDLRQVLGDSVAISRDGSQLLAVTSQDIATLFDAQTGLSQQTLSLPFAIITSLHFAAEDSEVILTSQNAKVYVFSAKSHLPIQTRAQKAASERLLAMQPDLFSPTQRYALTLLDTGDVSVEDYVSDGKTVRLTGHRAPVSFCKWSADLRWLITSSHDKTARIWNAKTLRLHLSLSGHPDSVHHATFSEDSQLVLTCCSDQSVRMFDVETGYLLAIYSTAPTSIEYAYFEEQDRRVVASCQDGLDRVFDATPETRSAETLTQRIALRAAVRFESASSPNIVEQTW